MSRRNPPSPPPPDDEGPDIDDLLADAPDIGDLLADAPDMGPDVSDLLGSAPVLPITVKGFAWILCPGEEEPEPRTILFDADTGWTRDEIEAELEMRGGELVAHAERYGGFGLGRTPEGCTLVRVTIEAPLYYDMPTGI